MRPSGHTDHLNHSRHLADGEWTTLDHTSIQSNTGTLIVAVEYVTGLTIVVPTLHKDTNQAMNLVQTIILIMSAPTEIVTDQGAEFSSDAFKALCEHNHIKHHTTSAHHPQGNGRVEKVNHLLKKKILKALTNDTMQRLGFEII